MAWTMKEHEVNRITSFFHLAAFLVTCTAMAQSSWFRLRGMQCVPHLGLAPFFGFGEFSSQPVPPSLIQRHILYGEIDQPSEPVTISYLYTATDSYACVSPRLVILMRIIIFLCFMIVLFSLLGIFLNVSNFKNEHIKTIQRYGVLSVFSFIWVMAIIGVCFFVTLVIEDETTVSFRGRNVGVSYEFGFYTITVAGVISIFGAATSLLTQNSTDADPISRRPLIDDWDGLESFNIGPSPRARTIEDEPTHVMFRPLNQRRNGDSRIVCDVSRSNSTSMEPALTASDLAMLPPPPPYTP